MSEPLAWSHAWALAAREFWARQAPDQHFTTSVGTEMADRIAQLVHDTDERLGHPDPIQIVDIGCGDGHLLALVRDRCPDLLSRAQWIGVDVRPIRVPGVSSIVAEAPGPLPLTGIEGLVMAHEWLDEVPCDVIERDEEGRDRLVLVDADGHETLGPLLADDASCAAYGVDARAARSWMQRWWPLQEPGDRAEIGVARDRAWLWMITLLRAGTVLATDYGHVLAERRVRHRRGTLTGYRSGRIVGPVPDGTVNLTAHVALDACVSAKQGSVVTSQREEIGAPTVGHQPTAADVERHFATLRLRDPARLGGVTWLRWEA